MPLREPKCEANSTSRTSSSGRPVRSRTSLPQRLERKIGLLVLELGVELERIGLHQRAEPERAALGVVPHVPVLAIEPAVDHHVGGDHRMRIDGLAGELDAAAGAHHAARAVGADQIAGAHGLVPAVGVLQASR